MDNSESIHGKKFHTAIDYVKGTSEKRYFLKVLDFQFGRIIPYMTLH